MNAPPTVAPLPSFSNIPHERIALVDAARERWVRELMDLSRRNNLLYFRETRATLNVSEHDPRLMRQLLAGGAVALERLLGREAMGEWATSARELQKRAVANLEEKGLETLFLAVGMATWRAADGGRDPDAAVLLVPITLTQRGRDYASFTLQRRGDARLNPTLLHVLEQSFGCPLDADALLEPPEAGSEAPDPTTIFERLARGAARVPGFRVKPLAFLGNFAYQKMAMVEDLTRHAGALAAHDLIAALAGDAGAREAIRAARREVNPRAFDQLLPDQEFLIRDADASQQRVIAAALGGQHLVVQGPPGTGKSQTIANLIAAEIAAGRRVLFVAEKRAALEVVFRRLDGAGLGHLALDLHGAELSTRDILRRLAATLALVRDAVPVPSDETHRRFADRRQRLNDHVARLHQPRPPSGLSVYELQGRLLRLPPEATIPTRWQGEALARLDAANAAAIRDGLADAGALAEFFLRRRPSPWLAAALPDGAAVERLREATLRLHGDLLPTLHTTLGGLQTITGLRLPESLDEADAWLGHLAAVNATLALYPATVWDEDLAALAGALAVGNNVLAGALAWWVKPSHRNARRRAQQLRGKRLSAPQHFREIEAALAQRRWWRSQSSEGARPVATDVAQATSLVAAARAALQTVEALTRQGDLARLRWEQLVACLAKYTSDGQTPFELIQTLAIERHIEQRGGGAIVAAIRQRDSAPHLWPLHFDHAWWSSCLDRARLHEPALGGFRGEAHSLIVDEFRALDHERLALASARVRRAHAERVIATLNAHPRQEELLRRETQKSRRHLPIRKLLAQAPDAVLALCPCWMASPLSVSQLLDAERRYFDLVIFDEASQVLPQDAVPAILRATQVVVAGDRHQLPPTTFFALGDRNEDREEAEPAPTAGFESVLDMMGGFLDPLWLTWHYRSRDEALIAFSNRHIYGDALVTFPGAGGEPALTHVLVPHVAADGQEESASEEVRRVVALALAHAEQRPHETLGVIAMGIRHADRIEEALRQALRERPDLDHFFDQSRDERFFVKNLERVQGDERDAILLSVGYGKDRAGRLPYRFGPLLQEGGERRLNVAVTRARQRLTLVSSFSHHDMDPQRATRRGVELLRLYLEFAATGGAILGERARSGAAMNPFEEAVWLALREQGIELLPQWGASRYRIDFVAQHPQRPGRFVLAIECDGASYHAAPTARDRDRLRQQHLEALGWRFHRVWSTDWFTGRDREVARAVAAFHQAVAAADKADSTKDTKGHEERHVAQAIADEKERPVEVALPAPQRGPRPAIRLRDKIGDYAPQELDQLVLWLQSDGRLRTDEEIIEELTRELGFQRRGPLIVKAIKQAIQRVNRL